MRENSIGKIKLREKIGYGVGDLANGLYLSFFGIFLFYFFVDLKGLAPAAIGLMLLITKLVDALTDPMMGILADRTNSRWGRYRPYLLFGAVPFGFCGVLVFAAPSLNAQETLIWAYVTYTLAMLAYTAVNVPYGGLLGVISPSNIERGNVAVYRMFFSALAGILIGIFGTTLVRELGGVDEARGIMLTMGVIAVISIFCLLTTFLTTKERIPIKASQGEIAADIKELLQTGPWIAIAIAAILGVTAISCRQASSLFFFEYVAGDDGIPVFGFFDRTALFLTALAIGQISGIFLSNFLQRRFEKSHLVISAGLLKSVAIMLFYAAPLDAFWLQTTVQYIVGVGFGMLMVLAFSMFTDISEFVDWRSNKLMTGLVVSASIFAVKAGVAFGLAIPGFVMGLTGFEAGIDQTENAKFGIDLAFSIIPAAMLLPGCIALLFYRLDRQTLATIEIELAERRKVLAKST